MRELSSLKNKEDASTSVSKTKTANPFDYLPEDKLEIIRKDFEKGNYRSDTFEKHLKSLHEDDMIPEEVLDIIESRNEPDGEVFSSVEELLKDLKKDD